MVVCIAMLHCHMTLQIVYSPMPEANLMVLMFPLLYHLSFDAAYETPADSSISCTNKYDAQRYLKY